MPASRANHPVATNGDDEVRQLQRRLWVAAKRDPGRRFHALYDRIFRGDVLEEAWKRVRANRGSAGVDAQTLVEVEQYGVERFLEELGTELREGRYRPRAVLRRYIPKFDGRRRPLRGGSGRLVEKRISDRRVLKLVRQWLEAGVMEDGEGTTPVTGTPQGGVISPLLSNIYLHVLDRVWEKRYAHLGRLIRYADDFVIVCRTRATCEEAERRVREILAWLGLALHPDKTRRVELSWGKQGFDFLGCHLRKRMSGRIWERERKRVYFLNRWPSARSMKRIRERVHVLTGRSRQGVRDVRVLIRSLNPVLRGWGAYFRTGNAARKFNRVDTYVWERLRGFMVARKGRHLRAGETSAWTREFFHGHGLYRLRGTVQYPEAA